MGAVGLESLICRHFGIEQRNAAVRVNGGYLVPHALGKRLDGAINGWNTYLSNLRPSQEFLTGFVTAGNPKFQSFIYLPGRQAVTKAWKPTFTSALNERLKLLNEQKYLPRSLNFAFEAAAKSIIDQAVAFGLPYLSVERALTGLVAAVAESKAIDLFAKAKRMARDEAAESFDKIAEKGLAASLETAVMANWLDSNMPHCHFDQLFSQPLKYYHDDLQTVLACLKQKPRKITYILDNAGESIFDLAVIQNLLLLGHQIKVIGHSRDPIAGEAVAWLRPAA